MSVTETGWKVNCMFPQVVYTTTASQYVTVTRNEKRDTLSLKATTVALVSNGLEVSFWLAFKSQNLPKSVKTQQTLTSFCCEMTVNSQCKAAPSMFSVLFSLGVLCSAISSEGWLNVVSENRAGTPFTSSVTNNRRHSQQNNVAPKLNIEPKKTTISSRNNINSRHQQARRSFL